jgi:FtsH-binding integral membrane protein
MSEKVKRQSPPKDSWPAFAFRCLATIVLYILSMGAQDYVDDQNRPMLLRCVAVLGYLLGLAIAFIWLYRWTRKADEYQRLVTFRNLAVAFITSIVVFVLMHIAYAFDNPLGHDWPIMGMPAYGILFAVIGSRPKKS